MNCLHYLVHNSGSTTSQQLDLEQITSPLSLNFLFLWNKDNKDHPVIRLEGLLKSSSGCKNYQKQRLTCKCSISINYCYNYPNTDLFSPSLSHTHTSTHTYTYVTLNICSFYITMEEYDIMWMFIFIVVWLIVNDGLQEIV